MHIPRTVMTHPGISSLFQLSESHQHRETRANPPTSSSSDLWYFVSLLSQPRNSDNPVNMRNSTLLKNMKWAQNNKNNKLTNGQSEKGIVLLKIEAFLIPKGSVSLAISNVTFTISIAQSACLLTRNIWEIADRSQRNCKSLAAHSTL